MDHRERAALEGRVSPLKSSWALAPAVVVPRQIVFLRSLLVEIKLECEREKKYTVDEHRDPW
jgi:hypothetical protein